MVRAAAKHAFTTVATDARQYAEILAQVQSARLHNAELRRKLAGEAFAHTAALRSGDCRFLCRRDGRGPISRPLHLGLQRQQVLRYGENPHQHAAVYASAEAAGATLLPPSNSTARSFPITICSILMPRLAMVRDFAEPAAVVIKHNNPCGAAEARRAEPVQPTPWPAIRWAPSALCWD